MRSAGVYRLYDAQGALLYVGSTVDVRRRMGEHALAKPWWGDVAEVTTEVCPSVAVALATEAEAIRAEQPRYNVTGTGGLTDEDRDELVAAASLIEQTRSELHEVIRRAVSNGASAREVAAEVGLSHTWVRKLAAETDGEE